jgi:hypothetical protein
MKNQGQLDDFVTPGQSPASTDDLADYGIPMTLIRHMSMSVRAGGPCANQSTAISTPGSSSSSNHCEVLEVVVDRISQGVRAQNFGVFSADFLRARALLQLIES